MKKGSIYICIMNPVQGIERFVIFSSTVFVLNQKYSLIVFMLANFFEKVSFEPTTDKYRSAPLTGSERCTLQREDVIYSVATK